MADRVPKVMVSSTFRDLEAERQVVRGVIGDHQMVPLVMERKAASATRGLLTNSFKMVDECDLYVLLIGRFYYGQIIKDKDKNPKNLSITELEFERAIAKGKPILVFLLHEDATAPFNAAELQRMMKNGRRLDAFRKRASDAKRVVQTFKTPADLGHTVGLSLLDWHRECAPSPPEPQSSEPLVAPIPLPDLCLGRDTDIATITAALTPGAAVFVHGPGGIGKTTITQQAAHHDAVKARFLDRRWFVELDTATDRDTFDAQLLLGLELSPTAGFAAAVHRLGQAPALLVLDNLETPWEADPLAIEARIGQLAVIPGLTLLASFRGDEHVGGARWSPRHPVAPLSDPDARALFLEIAGAAKSTDPDLPAFLHALGGVPLAICLTARRAARPPTLAGLWGEWGRLGAEVASLTTGTRHRLTSVMYSIALSLGSSRMTPDAHRLFAILGQCPAGLAPEDRIALLGDAAFAAEEALRGTGLAHLRADHRLDLLPPVRDHARRAHKPAEADASACCWHFLDRARAEGGRILWDGGAEALAALTPEVANIDAALRVAPGLGLRQPAVAALGGVYRLLSASGVGSPAALAALADACHAADDAAGEAACHFRHGLTSLFRSDHEGARARYEEALPLYRRVGSVLGEANCIKSLGDIALARSDHEGARARYEEALPLFRRVGDVRGEANCIKSLGDIALRRSDHEGARARYEEALPLYRRVGAVLGEANCIRSLGDIARRRADQEGARARYEEALPLFRRVGDVLGEANCRLGQGRVAAGLGDKAGAQSQAEAALALYQRVHATDNIAIAHEDLAAVTEGAERAAHVAAAVAAWREMGLEDRVARVEGRFG